MFIFCFRERAEVLNQQLSCPGEVPLLHLTGKSSVVDVSGTLFTKTMGVFIYSPCKAEMFTLNTHSMFWHSFFYICCKPFSEPKDVSVQNKLGLVAFSKNLKWLITCHFLQMSFKHFDTWQVMIWYA